MRQSQINFQKCAVFLLIESLNALFFLLTEFNALTY
jgi:hypothetical protein